MKRSINEIGSVMRSIKEHLSSVYGDRIKRVMVYGSFAKGEADEEPDVNIAVVVADELNPNKAENNLDSFLFQILMEKSELGGGVRNSRKQIQYIQLPAHTKHKGGGRSDMKELNRMTPTLEHHQEKTRRNIVLVGVAGVGKTTLGKRAAKKLGMSFVDVDMGFEDVEGSDIDTLLNQYGGEGFNKRTLTYFATLINRADYTIFATPARVTHYKRFWEVVRLKGISIHLRGKPMEVYMRQDMWVNGRKITKEEKLKSVKRLIIQFEFRVASKLMQKVYVKRSQKSYL